MAWTFQVETDNFETLQAWLKGGEYLFIITTKANSTV